MSSSDVNIGGMILNVNNAGFTVDACLREMIDNSIDAGATKIVIKLNTEERELIHVDNGEGILWDNIRDAFCLHNRTPTSSHKQGRFGIGGKAARINLTEANGNTYTFTKGVGDSATLCMVHINWTESISKSIYQPAFINCTDAGIIPVGWNKHRLAENGYVDQISCSDKKFRMLLNSILSKDPHINIPHKLCRDYYNHLSNGVSINIMIDNDVIHIQPYDPLVMHMQLPRHVLLTDIHVYANDSFDIQAYWKEDGQEFRINTETGRKIKATPEKLSSSWNMIGKLQVQSVYCTEWDSLTKDHYMKVCNLSSEEYNNTNNKIRSSDNCIYLQRQNKVICTLPTRKGPKSGDKAAYEFTDESRHLVKFDESLDTYMGVQTNKSYIHEDDIEPSIRGAFRECIKNFCKQQYLKWKTQTQEETTIRTVSNDTMDTLPETIDDEYDNDGEGDDVDEEENSTPVRTAPAVAHVPAYKRVTGVSDQMIHALLPDLKDAIAKFDAGCASERLTNETNTESTQTYKAIQQIIEWLNART